jgi:hypothetical protein
MMQLFFLGASLVLLIMVPLLLYSSTRLMKGTKTSTYLSALLCFLVGVGSLYIGLM